jgi:multicomponent Na+:H+ antiporter subunit D
MLVFLAGMVGFCLTGDIFNMFVWFELMGVAAYGLTAYRIEERGPLQGALNFAITNSVGAYLTLSGIALIYGRTGALNMAQISRSISGHHPDGLVIVAFGLILIGFLTKASIVPFHFWLADAHAVAPTPVCVLFSGVMVELGLYAVARVYWSVFGAGLGHRGSISAVLLVMGAATALVGAVFCFRQRHIKRLLAFSTISHAGLFLMGMALLTPLGLAGAAVYVVGHGLVKAALFLCVGIVLHRLGSVDETRLHGRGRPLRATGIVFVLASLGLADLPPFALYLGAGWIGQSGSSRGVDAVTAVVIVSSVVVGGALLRVAGGVFFGIGDAPSEDPRMAKESSEETSETESETSRTPLSMIVPPTILVSAAVAVGLWPGLGSAFESAAVRFQDQSGYQSSVLTGQQILHPVALLATESTAVTLTDVLTGLGTAVASIGVAFLALYWRRIPILRRGSGGSTWLTSGLDRLQSGVINDYVTWLIIGAACFGGALAITMR